MDWKEAEEHVDTILKLYDDGERILYFSYVLSHDELIWVARVLATRLKKALGLKDTVEHMSDLFH